MIVVHNEMACPTMNETREVFGDVVFAGWWGHWELPLDYDEYICPACGEYIEEAAWVLESDLGIDIDEEPGEIFCFCNRICCVRWLRWRDPIIVIQEEP